MVLLVASLDALEEHQQLLISRLQAIYVQLEKGDGYNDELLPTLTYYINQASYIQRRMLLIHARANDLKRRSERLREHREKQDRQVAEWMAREQQKMVPAAVPAGSDSSESLCSRSVAGSLRNMDSHEGSSVSLPSSPVPKSVSRFGTPQPMQKSSSLRSPLGPEPQGNAISRSFSGIQAVDIIGKRLQGLGIQALGSSIGFTSTNPSDITTRPGSSTPQPESNSLPSQPIAVDVPVPAAPTVATIKRTGKRKVRVPKIE
ncbi:hypothetical protein J3B02_004339 [Coemansia erecta]|uniref:Uncharacterized protein n=1 Tax=Coemansia asiatica TaxID=1052880 RepID=A0A9W8CM85_9FUNG|nr:hypothetical protein LPJ64_001113 [Coemansia asiatica]KAJ2846722.1 hypothetical protein J3B02_004339 [Coemansia erecta]KAJ2888182.1 hypothetical protein FB639_000813 [Coemansia asiatica]